MAPPRRRWVCPSCGSGVNAPERPRRDDVRRYCLDCSAETGRLVERTCPALEKKRQTAREKRAARTITNREREAEAELAARSVGDFDLLAEAKRIWNLPTMKELRGRGSRPFPEIEWRRSAHKARTSGHCWFWAGSRLGQDRIVITIGRDSYGAVATVIHELVHAVSHEKHSRRFWTTMRCVAKEAFPEAPFNFVSVPDGWRTDSAVRNGIAKEYGSRVMEVLR